MARSLNLACLQTRPRPDFSSALSEALTLADAAVSAGAQMLLLPEYCGGLRTEGRFLAPPAEPEVDHPVLQELKVFARARKVWIMVGSVAVSDAAGKFLNRSLMIDDTGTIKSRYDKIHLFDVQLSETEAYRESERISPGNEAVLTETPYGMIGHTICYDLRFPTLFRDLARAGAEIIVVPAAFTKRTGEAHWHVLNRARAIENGVFIVAPCAIGPVEGGGESYGHSLVVDPWGEVVADGGDIPGVVHATIDLDQVAATRGRIPSLSHDRSYRPAASPGGTEEVTDEPLKKRR
ncbi:carbon-nitrogen hydrolase family protein [Aurantimonas sp. E1-2-R+4]|uniref:carbon-nitrogen hydrolase family protein n=1 Tax=Aurantimonas sp. E1-2-R+4 TaxID=3113714 RepID=UPI002F93EF8F